MFRRWLITSVDLFLRFDDLFVELEFVEPLTEFLFPFTLATILFCLVAVGGGLCNLSLFLLTGALSPLLLLLLLVELFVARDHLLPGNIGGSLALSEPTPLGLDCRAACGSGGGDASRSLRTSLLLLLLLFELGFGTGGFSRGVVFCAVAF